MGGRTQPRTRRRPPSGATAPPLTRLDYRPAFPEGYRPGVGVIGCGGIVKLAHLAAYTAYGVDVVGVYDPAATATEGIRERYPVVGRVFESLDDLLADPRVETLTTSFASQWLLVRNVATVRPGENYALNWDETLRRSMQRETELFVDSIIRENRPAVEMLTADYTFLNERLARH